MTLPAALRAEYQRAAAFAHYAQQEVARGTRTQEDADTWTHLADVLHRAADALEWRPIADAPRIELADIILSNGKVVCAGMWWEGRWTTAHDEITPQPTHWLPLPATPEGDNNSTNDEEKRNG